MKIEAGGEHPSQHGVGLSSEDGRIYYKSGTINNDRDFRVQVPQILGVGGHRRGRETAGSARLRTELLVG